MMEKKYSFFNVALRDGHVMSTPVYEPALEFVPSLLYEVISINPEFCWIEFVFRERDMMLHLLRVKRDLHDFVGYAETQRRTSNGELVDRRERDTEWYRTAPKRIKKIDEMRSGTTVLLGIQGMWASRTPSSDLSRLSSLFSSSRDEIDALRIRRCDTRMLRELVKRRIVIEELPEYFRKYNTVSREEPPTLVLTQKEIPYYIHLPVENDEKLSKYLEHGAPRSTISQKIANAAVCEIQTIPVMGKKQIDEADTARLGHMPSQVYSRSMEIIYQNGKLKFLLSSESSGDLVVFQQRLSSIYGEMGFIPADPVPDYVKTTVIEDFRTAVNEKLGKKKK